MLLFALSLCISTSFPTGASDFPSTSYPSCFSSFITLPTLRILPNLTFPSLKQ